ncbi:Replication factor-A C terminal domain-containing protein [Forsythia ovata]|uniref:Replication factor-A C terminal domain-containing protein n=1 Tax=Forsythia ovata TaxID=205694 RepID=A0ABD1WRH6_9LAMI
MAVSSSAAQFLAMRGQDQNQIKQQHSSSPSSSTAPLPPPQLQKKRKNQPGTSNLKLFLELWISCISCNYSRGNSQATPTDGLILILRLKKSYICLEIDIDQRIINQVEENIEKLNQMFIKKNYLATTQIKLSPPSKDKVIEIGNIQGLLVVQNHLWVEARAYIRVFNQSFWYMACDICNKISSASYGEVYDCIFCKSARARASARARVFVELEDSTSSINGTMIGEPAEKMMQCSARRLMALTSPAVKKDGLADQWKYDIIFMLEPLAMTENIQEVIQPQHSSSTSQSLNSVPHPLSPPAKRLLFEVPPVSTSNKRLTEENHLHGNANTAILKLSGSTASAITHKENDPATT